MKQTHPDESQLSDERSPNSPPRRSTALAGGVGTLIEGYDFSMYGYMSVFLASVFFVGDNRFLSLMLTLTVFAASYAVRPLGGIVFGHLGDRVSRRTALLLSLLLMGGSSFVIGLLPTFAAVGVAAPLLLLALRLVQGFSVGGEVAGATTMVSETAGPRRQGLFGSFNPLGATLGFALASGVSALVTTFTTDEQMLAWGWRIPFLVAGPLAILCFILRRRLIDPRPPTKDSSSAQKRLPIVSVIRELPAEVALGAGLSIAMNGTAYFGLTYVSIHMIENVGYSSSTAFGVTTLVIAISAVLMPIAGLIADRIGLMQLAIVGSVGYAVLSFVGLGMINSGSVTLALIGFMVYMINTSAMQVAVYAGSPSLFPSHLRFTGMALGYNIGVAIAGGFAPVVSLWLAEKFGSLAPAGFPVAVSLIGMACAVIVIVRRRSGKSQGFALPATTTV